MFDTIVQAINNRNEISFTYSGILRVVQPSAIGVSTAGNDVLRCFQTQGDHVRSGHEWDLCAVSGISNLRLTGNVFNENPRGYKQGDKGMTIIYAEL